MRPLVNVDYIIHNLDKLTPEQAYNLGYDLPVRKDAESPLDALAETNSKELKKMLTKNIDERKVKENLKKLTNAMDAYTRKQKFNDRLGYVLAKKQYKETGAHPGNLFHISEDLMNPNVTEKEIKNVAEDIDRKYVTDAIKDIFHSNSNDLLNPNYRLATKRLKILEEASNLKPKIFKILPSIITKK